MAKAILKFDLTDPDDKMDHFRCIKALDMACVLFEIRYNLRRNAERAAESSEISATDFIFDQIDGLFDGHNINIDELLR
jgi:hypothetical protein